MHQCLVYETCIILSSLLKNSSNFPEKNELNPFLPIKKLDVPNSGGIFSSRAGITGLPYKRRHDKGVTESAPNGGWRFSPSLPAMNKQPTLHQDKKTRQRQIKVHDLPPKRNLNGGSSGKGESENSGIPTSLQEFLQRDSLPINSN